MKNISDIFYSLLCGISTWMAIHQIFIVLCMICSANQNDVLLPIIPLACYMLILVFAQPLTNKLYGKKPKLCLPIYLTAFIACITAGIAGDKTEGLLSLSVSKQVNLNSQSIIIGALCYVIICSLIIFLSVKTQKTLK